MDRSTYTRRHALRAIGAGTVVTVVAGAGGARADRGVQDGRRPEERLQLVEARPDDGFNYPFWLATPESFRSAPVPLLVTMNRTRAGRPLTGGGPDQPRTVAEMARSEVESLQQVGAWVSERLGVPQIVPVFPLPDGDPVDSTHKTVQLDRETMLIEGTDLERIDRQLLAMTEHARDQVLGDRETHDELLFWGNSSAGNAAEHMAVLHPERIMGVAAAGINGVVTLPLAELGPHTLNYPIGVADYEAITGRPFDVDAFDAVSKFYILGAHDTHKRLKFDVPGELPGTWADPDIYATAKAVYGFDMAEDSLPRCHIAFEKAGVSGQFRIYPEMTHDPTPARSDVLEFLRRTIAGEEVSAFGQRLTLPFDRTVDLQSADPTVGEPLDLAVSGEYPPPEGLVSYTWELPDGRSQSGPETTYTVDGPGTDDLTLRMETAHGQATERGMTFMANESSMGVYRYDVSPPRAEFTLAESLLLELDVENVGTAQGDRRLEFRVDGERRDSRGTALAPGESKRISFSQPFADVGDYEVSVVPAFRQTVSVQAAQTPSPTAGGTETTAPPTSTAGSPGRDGQESTRTSASGPGFSVPAAIAAIGSALGYLGVRGRENTE